MSDLVDIPTSGGDLFLLVIDAVEQESRAVLRREEIARARGQAVDPDQMQKGALLAAAVEMLAVMKADGDALIDQGKKPYLAQKAALAGIGSMRALNRQNQQQGIAA
jgi:hypothetical protein